tara:strand:+ start:1186 stop:1995 length:810 start_codon:yes stop_codon:yes gene_type:complete
MKIFKSFNILNKEINFNEKVGFVPTMGALHSGHLNLIKEAKKKTKKVLVSIYVNPTQFNNKKDFQNYPRNFNKDIIILKKHKVDYLFIPNHKEIYKNGIIKKFKIFKKDKVLCAKSRNGHFEGVLTVVNRFMHEIKSKYIFFGNKDFQQVYLIKKYLQDKFDTKIKICKTIRNKNKLPLSSRNILLSNSSLKRSEKISNLLFNFKNKILKKAKNVKLKNSYKKKIIKLCDKLEYFEIRNSGNLSSNIDKKKFKIFVAYYQKNVRLIDNV